MPVVIVGVSVCLVLHSLFYIALFIRLYEGRAGGSLLRFLAPVGRMGLTNYFGQTLLSLGLFYSTGWVGKAGPLALLGCALVIFMVQLWMSRWWLSRYEFGPVEWVWRRLAYALVPNRSLEGK